jgi:nucleoside-diphosphate-sugar epimerase
MIALLEKNLGKKANLEFGEKIGADMDITWADISKAKNLLGWEPQVSFEEGIKKLCDWHQVSFAD